MRITAPFSTDGQPGVKLVRNLVPCPKIAKPLFTHFGMNTNCAIVDGFLFIQRTRRRYTGRHASLRARGFPKLFLDDFQRKPRDTSGLPLVQRTPFIIMTTIIRTIITGGIVVLIYSFFCTIARRGNNSFRHFLETENLKMRRKRIPGSRQKETMDAETSRQGVSEIGAHV